MTPEEKAFQAHLDAHPDDHTARLVFADWLEEHGDVRAEGYRMLGMLGRWPYEYIVGRFGYHNGHGSNTVFSDGSLTGIGVTKTGLTFTNVLVGTTHSICPALIKLILGYESFWVLEPYAISSRSTVDDKVARAFGLQPLPVRKLLIEEMRETEIVPTKPRSLNY